MQEVYFYSLQPFILNILFKILAQKYLSRENNFSDLFSAAGFIFKGNDFLIKHIPKARSNTRFLKEDDSYSTNIFEGKISTFFSRNQIYFM